MRGLVWERLAEMGASLREARARIAELEAAQANIAIIHVQSGPSGEAWPIVERVPGGWQSGAHHYRDADVLDVSPIVADGSRWTLTGLAPTRAGEVQS
ncbi:hypothetical protein A5789_24925 [Nocardia sp. 852002-51101_SCH5132738]|uniref:hypothetical protein n=1 Tax=Nocardia sp. 852002-51101_SCH5132738 TaxID=1834095 RepID=UPI0007E9F81D|nr:hypothetical protein [Nocardia sp. 852002-51101_SCH5132738]OBA53056.1 hypothetical protein A5789_24925 [Nocardia sp. 852002-51101_SCH5132738]